MTHDAANPDDPLPLYILERVDRKCLEFEALWSSGRSVRVEDFLTDTSGVERLKTLRELLLLDLDYRIQNAETPTAAEYESRFPADTDLVKDVFRQLATELGDETVLEAAAESATQIVGPGMDVGARFRVLRRHARGGLGEVFVAEDRQLNREVAIKEILPRHANNVTMRARFVREAEITGGLEHPGVVPVHSVGRHDDGRLFYTMRFIHGDRLTDAVKRYFDPESRRSSAERSIEFRKLLVRFIDVCETVEYAHSRGVVHRDLKPENIMLGKYGETLIVDWGLATTLADQGVAGAVTDETPLVLRPPETEVGKTRAGSAIGTPAFMSPEQAAGQRDEIGPRSDVYGLGATLYFILTGKQPFTGDDTVTILLRVQEGRFDPPRRIRPETPRVLDAICLKAMARDPEDRYVSAKALSEDIEAWLADEPTGVCPEPRLEKVRRFVRRHHTPIGVAALFLVLMFVGLGVGLALLSAKNRELEVTNDRESAARKQSEKHFGLAMEAIESYYTGVSEDVLLRERKLTDLREGLLKTSLSFYEKLRQDLEADDRPESRAALANAYGAIARITRRIRRFEKSVSAHEKAVAILESLADQGNASVEVRRDLVDSYNALGGIQDDIGDSGKAKRSYERAAEIARSLVSQGGDQAVDRGRLAHCHNNLGCAGSGDEAREHFEEAIRIQGELVAECPDRNFFQYNLAKHHANLAYWYSEQGDVEPTRAQYLRAIEIIEPLAEKQPEETSYCEELTAYTFLLSYLQYKQGELDSALHYVRKSLAVAEGLVRDYGNVDDYQSLLVTRYNHLGLVLRASDREAAADEAFAKAIAGGKRLVEYDPSMANYAIMLGGSYCNRADLARKRGDLETAIRICGDAIATLEPIVDRDDSKGRGRKFLRNSYGARASALNLAERYDEAVDDWIRAIELTPNPQDFLYINQARSLALSGDHARAAAMVRQLTSKFTSPSSQYGLACVWALTSKAAREDELLPEEKRVLLAGQYADRAVERLDKAQQLGYFDRPERTRLPSREIDLRSLRDHAGFQQFTEQLTKQ